MNIGKTLRTFAKFRVSILSDGKVDEREAEKLLAFVGKYVKSGNAKYADFENILHRYLEDGVITDEESAKIVSLMDDMTSFFKIELLVKSILVAILVVALVVSIAYIALG